MLGTRRGKVWACGSEGGWAEGLGTRSEGRRELELTPSVPEWVLMQRPLLAQVFEIRTTEDLTEAWLQEKLSFFR